MHGAPKSGAVNWKSRGTQHPYTWTPDNGHVVKQDPFKAILKEGFDSRLANSGMMGHGIYCAERPCKSDRYALRYSTDPTSKSSGERAQLLLCRVALGQPFVTEEHQRGIRRPPCLEGHVDSEIKCDHPRFDSVVFQGWQKYREFVVFDGAQVFPEFLVEYVRE